MLTKKSTAILVFIVLPVLGLLSYSILLPITGNAIISAAFFFTEVLAVLYYWNTAGTAHKALYFATAFLIIITGFIGLGSGYIADTISANPNAAITVSSALSFISYTTMTIGAIITILCIIITTKEKSPLNLLMIGVAVSEVISIVFNLATGLVFSFIHMDVDALHDLLPVIYAIENAIISAIWVSGSVISALRLIKQYDAEIKETVTEEQIQA